MAHAVISCLHANLAAVEAVLADIDRQGINMITCLGDLVGYGPQPNEVVDIIRQRDIPPVKAVGMKTSLMDLMLANAATHHNLPNGAAIVPTTGLRSR